MRDQDEAPLPRIFRLNDLVRKGYGSRSTIWRRVGAGRFPPPVQLGDNSIGWPAREIDGWLNSQPRRTYGGPTEAAQEAEQPTPTKAQITEAMAAQEAQHSVSTAPEIATAPPVPKRGPNGKAKPGSRRSSKPKWGRRRASKAKPAGRRASKAKSGAV
jgi:prophage regulatory protein